MAANLPAKVESLSNLAIDARKLIAKKLMASPNGKASLLLKTVKIAEGLVDKINDSPEELSIKEQVQVAGLVMDIAKFACPTTEPSKELNALSTVALSLADLIKQRDEYHSNKFKNIKTVEAIEVETLKSHNQS